MKSLSSTLTEGCGFNVKNRALKNMALRTLAVFCFMLGLFATQAFAQEATIVGTVTDPTGAALPDVNLTITSVETAQARTITTNQDGQFVAPDLPIGHYSVRAQKSGFKALENKDIVLNVGDRTRLDLQMQVGAAQETVTVEADAVKVQSDTGEVSDVITGQQVSQLSTNGRSVYTLFALT